jgi:RNA polymerase sigma factor (sigma-70 family)
MDRKGTGIGPRESGGLQEGSALSLSKVQYVQQVLAIKRAFMRGWLWSVTHETQSLEDLRQEVYARLLAIDDGTLATIRSVEAYARGICRYVAMDWLEARHVRRVLRNVETCDVFEDEGQTPEAILSARQRVERIRSAIELLTERQRRVLVLRRIYGFTAKEIAMRMDIKVPTVKRHLYNAIRACEGSLGADDASSGVAPRSTLTQVKE